MNTCIPLPHYQSTQKLPHYRKGSLLHQNKETAAPLNTPAAAENSVGLPLIPKHQPAKRTPKI